MDISLTGKNALVCGGSKGIGFASAMALSGMGASVTLLSRDETALKEAVAKLSLENGQSHGWLVADLSEPDLLRSIIDEFLENTQIHILINNAGGPKSGAIVDADLAQFRNAFAVHVLSSHVLAQAVLPGMQEAGFGRIINIISTSVKQPIPGLGVSNTIRGAMGNWSKTLAGEVARDGITVNNVLPGMTGTDRLRDLFSAMALRQEITPEAYAAEMTKTIPIGRFATPEEIANAVAFLSSPAASYITGTNLVADGGRTGSL